MCMLCERHLFPAGRHTAGETMALLREKFSGHVIS